MRPLLFVLFSICLILPVRAEMSWMDAADRLQQERGAAVACVRAAKQYLQETDTLFELRQSYEAARTEINAVLARLDVALINDEEDDVLETLKPRLSEASKERAAFCDSVTAAVEAQSTEGEKNLIGLVTVAGDVLDAAVEVWKEYRKGDDLRRSNLRTALEDAKWPEFDDIS